MRFPRLGARRLVVLAALVALSASAALSGGCGKPDPLHQGKTAKQWVDALYGPDPEVQRDATNQLIEFAKVDLPAVTSALEAALRRPAEPYEGAPVSVEPDREQVRREGLSGDFDGAAAANMVLAPLRARLRSAGLKGPVNARSDGRITIVLPPRPRAEIEEALRVLTARGSVELRPVVRAPDDATTPRGLAYEGAAPFADFLAAETRRFVEGKAPGRSYKPSDPRYRVAPRAGTKGETAADFVVLREPDTAEGAIDERLASATELARAPDGKTIVLRLHVRAGRGDVVRRFGEASLGRAVAAVVDGAARATTYFHVSTEGDVVEFGLWGDDGPASEREATSLVSIAAGGRLPVPLKAVPLDASLGREPAVDAPPARAFVAIGEPSIPTLESISKDEAAPPHVTASARWALEQIRHAAPR